MPKDELTIYVKTTNAEASKPFNLFTNGSYANADNNNLTGYLVNNDGTINFPVLGRIHVGGLTRPEVEDTIAKMLKPYLSEKETGGHLPTQELPHHDDRRVRIKSVGRSR